MTPRERETYFSSRHFLVRHLERLRLLAAERTVARGKLTHQWEVMQEALDIGLKALDRERKATP